MDRGSELGAAADRAVLNTAWAATLRLNGVGVAVRFACVAVIAVTTLAVGTPAQWLLFLPSAAGVFLAALDRFGEQILRAPQSGPVARVARQIVKKRAEHVAGPSLPGLLEGIGMVAMAFLVAGPAPLPVSGFAHVACIAALLVLVGDVLSQTLLDVAWYNLNFPAPPWMVAFRWVVPPLASVIAYLMFTWPSPQTLSTPAALVTSASFLFLWPWTALMSTAMTSGRAASLEVLTAELDRVDSERTEALHAVKVVLKSRASALDEADPSTSLQRRTIESVLADVTLDWARSAAQNDWLSASDVWAACTVVERFSAAEARGAITIHDQTGGWGIAKPGTSVLRALLMDLTDNAIKAGSHSVRVTIQREDRGRRTQLITVTVDDDGPGHFPTNYPPSSSLGTLSGHCSRMGGQFRHEPRPTGGTRVVATYFAGVRRPEGEPGPLPAPVSAPETNRERSSSS